MKTYDLTYIITSDISSEEAEAKAKEIEALVKSKEGTVVSQITPVAKPLSYPVGKRASGFMGTIEFQAEGDKAKEIEEAVTKDKKVLRSMMVIKNPLKEMKARRVKPGTVIETKEEAKPEPTQATVETKTEESTTTEETPLPKMVEKDKIELEDIDKKLDEILGQ